MKVRIFQENDKIQGFNETVLDIKKIESIDSYLNLDGKDFALNDILYISDITIILYKK